MQLTSLIILLFSTNSSWASPKCLYNSRVAVTDKNLSQFIQSTRLYDEVNKEINSFGPFTKVERTDQVVLSCITSEGVVLHLNTFVTIKEGDGYCGYDSLVCYAGFIHVTNSLDKIIEENVTVTCRKDVAACSDY